MSLQMTKYGVKYFLKIWLKLVQILARCTTLPSPLPCICFRGHSRDGRAFLVSRSRVPGFAFPRSWFRVSTFLVSHFHVPGILGARARRYAKFVQECANAERKSKPWNTGTRDAKVFQERLPISGPQQRCGCSVEKAPEPLSAPLPVPLDLLGG